MFAASLKVMIVAEIFIEQSDKLQFVVAPTVTPVSGSDKLKFVGHRPTITGSVS
jgi:hypothetical protein